MGKPLLGVAKPRRPRPKAVS